MKKQKIIFFMFVLILLAGCQSKTQQVTQETTSTTSLVKLIETGQDKANENSQAANTNIVQIDMTAKKFEFNPSIITVNKGDKVKIKITSTDVAHGFAIPDYSISQKVDVGKTETIEFIADKSGEFTFFCNVFCGSGHKEMKGKLIVK